MDIRKYYNQDVHNLWCPSNIIRDIVPMREKWSEYGINGKLLQHFKRRN
jgi:hypothetical protein